MPALSADGEHTTNSHSSVLQFIEIAFLVPDRGKGSELLKILSQRYSTISCIGSTFSLQSLNNQFDLL
jgi:hypothetical protein